MAKGGVSSASFLWDLAGSLPLTISDDTTSFVFGPGGLPVEQVAADNSVLFYHHDQIGSTRLLTDATGAVQATYVYDPYGSLNAATGTVSAPLLYTGQYQDNESGHYYLRARYYDPATAQFLTVDPAVATTMSPYAYVAGNPLNAIDPSGLVSGQEIRVCIAKGLCLVINILGGLGIIHNPQPGPGPGKAPITNPAPRPPVPGQGPPSPGPTPSPEPEPGPMPSPEPEPGSLSVGTGAGNPNLIGSGSGNLIGSGSGNITLGSPDTRGSNWSQWSCVWWTLSITQP
jgi:RHS repeat-associated protein